VTPDVIVVGGGVIGSAIAYRLSKDGRAVLLLDRGAGDGQASSASAGILAPLSEDATPSTFVQLADESLRLYAPLMAELGEATGIDAGYRQTGLLRVALDEADEAQLARRHALQRSRGLAGEWLDALAVREVEPGLSRQVRAGLLATGDAQVSPPALLRALKAAARQHGAEVRSGSTVDDLVRGGERVTGVRIGHETISAGEVILANGAWAGAWSSSLGLELPVQPVRGQMVGLLSAGPAHMVFATRVYAAPKADGWLYVGATEEPVGFDPRTTAAGVSELLRSAIALLPGLADATVWRVGAGLRPGTPDRLPMIGRVPGCSGVSLAAGHFRNGVLLAPITAEVISDILSTGRPRLPMTAFDPARFGSRAA
jgi:glycine oxidase